VSDLSGPRLARWRLIERLVELASPAEAQLTYLSTDGTEFMAQKVWELPVEFWEWCSFLPEMVRQGVVTPDLASTVSTVVETIRSMDRDAEREWSDHRINWLHTPEALATDPRWDELRHLALEALDGFEALGLPIPNLSDEDFNTPREDTP
jgi:hypothetical protein